MTFIIARRYLLGLGNWLNSLALQGPQSRARTKFIRLVDEALKRADKERMELLEEYAEKDEKGEFVKVKDDKGEDSYKIPEDKIKEFNQGIVEIYDADAEITAPEISTTLITLRNLVVNTEEKIPGSLALDYDVWCEAFEKLQLN
jgi:hypothetical protein